MLFLTRPASPSSQVRWKCLFEVLLLTFPPGCKLQLLLDYTDSGSEKETWQMMCGTMPTFKARPATFPDVIFFTLHPPQQWGAKREERGEKTASQTEQKACSSKEKKNHTHQHEISNVALMLHWYTNRKEFSCLLDECFSSLLGDVSSSTYSPRCEFVAAAVFTQIRIYRVDIGDRSSVSAGVWTKAWKNEVS